MISSTVPTRAARLSAIALLFASLGAAQTASLNLPSGSGSPGSVVTLNLSLTSTVAQPAALQWTANYATQDITSVNVTAGNGAMAPISCNNTPGTSTCVVWATNSNTISDGVVATLAFTIAGSTTDPSSAIQLSQGDAVSIGGSAISTSTTGNTIALAIAPPPPVISSATMASGSIGTAFSYQITASNSPASYGATGLPTGLSVNTATGLISGTPAAAGTSTVTLSATNSGGTGNATLTLTITAATPVISSATTASGTVGTAFSYQITASNSPASYGATGLAAGLSVNTATGLISGTPTAAGTSTVTLSATNSGGTGNATLTLTITAATQAPGITSSASASGKVGSSFSYQITATNSPASYGATGLPTGLSVNTATGLISGTPAAAGTSTVTLSATNSGGTGNATLTLTITAATPVISSATTASGTVGTAFSYQITASNSPASYGATGLAAGLSVNTATGLISGTPTAAGTSTVTLSATNSGGTGNATLTLTITAATPVISSATTASGTVGAAFSYQIAASNSPASYGATGLAAGLSVNTATGLISGTPTAAGTSSITLSAINSGGAGHAVLTLTITGTILQPGIYSSASASGKVGSPFSYQIGATYSPTSYTAPGLPAGLSLNTTTGLISGTPTAAGTTSVIMSAINSVGAGHAYLTLTITGASGAPVITSADAAGGRVGTAFSFQIAATNSPTSFSATGLPAGLSINAATGLISGTPAAAGTSTVTLSASNSSGTGKASLTLTFRQRHG